MSRTAIVALICFVLGGAAGAWVATQFAPEPSPTTTLPVTTVEPRTRDEATERSQTKTNPASPLAPGGRRPASTPVDISALIRSAPVPRAKGPHAIEGRVRTADGEPVEGVTIRATAIGPAREHAANAPASLDQKIRAFVHAHVWEEATRTQTTTDAGGRYTLRDLADHTYRVHASKRGFEIATDAERTNRVPAGGHLDFIASSAARLSVDVRTPDGRAAAACSLRVYGTEQTATMRFFDTFAWRAESPWLTLRDGRHAIQAVTEDGMASTIVNVTVRGAEPPAPIALQLQRVAGVHGRVVVNAVERPAALYVWLVALEPGEDFDKADAPKRGRSCEVSAADDYGYDFVAVQPGRYALAVGRVYDTADHVEWFEVPRSATPDALRTKKDVFLPPPDLREFVRVTLVGPPGVSLRRAHVESFALSDEGDVRESDLVIPGADDTYWVKHGVTTTEGATRTRHFISARTASTGRIIRPYRPGVDASVTIRFAVAATLNVTLINGSSDELPQGLQVQIAEARAPWSGPAEGPDERGVVKLGPVQPGGYRMSLALETREAPPVELARMEVTLTPGQNAMSLPVPTLHQVQVEYPGGRGSSITLFNAGQTGSRWGQVGTDERVTFRNVPAGEYTLSAMPDGVMQIHVPTPGVVRFEPKAYNALCLQRLHPDTPLAKAGFQVGDIVIGIDGKRFEDLGDITAAIGAAARAKREQAIDVDRQGRRLSIRCDPRHLRGPRSGGRFEPTRHP